MFRLHVSLLGACLVLWGAEDGDQSPFLKLFLFNYIFSSPLLPSYSLHGGRSLETGVTGSMSCSVVLGNEPVSPTRTTVV